MKSEVEPREPVVIVVELMEFIESLRSSSKPARILLSHATTRY